MNVHYRNKEVYPQIDKPFRCIDTYSRKAPVPLWVHPFSRNAQWEHLFSMYFDEFSTIYLIF